MTDDSPMDPQENPTNTDHLPVSGEVGVGPVPYHDPVTTDTNDDPEDEPSISDIVEGASDDPAVGNMPPAGS